jgi:hypothetical protein
MTFAIVLDEVLIKVNTRKTLQLTHAQKITVMKLFGKNSIGGRIRQRRSRGTSLITNALARYPLSLSQTWMIVDEKPRRHPVQEQLETFGS